MNSMIILFIISLSFCTSILLGIGYYNSEKKYCSTNYNCFSKDNNNIKKKKDIINYFLKNDYNVVTKFKNIPINKKIRKKYINVDWIFDIKEYETNNPNILMAYEIIYCTFGNFLDKKMKKEYNKNKIIYIYKK